MKTNDSPDKSRRAALLRLGLGAVVAYAAPALTTLSQAYASEGSAGSGGSGGGSGGAGGDGGSGGSAGGSSGSAAASATASAASAASATSGASDGDTATISHRDHRRAQRAVSEGRALPLNEVLKTVHGSLGGRLISVKFRENQDTSRYVFKVVTNEGRLVEVNVDARTATIVGASR